MAGQAFQPARLVLARTLRGFQQNQLAEDVGVSATAISQFESGANAPSEETIERLALRLACLPDYFTRPLHVRGAGEPFFRSRRSAPKRERTRARSYAIALAEVATLLEEFVELPAMTLPDPDPPLPDTAPLGEVESAAARFRLIVGMPPGPVPNVTRLLEARGALVMAVGDFDRVDAFSLRIRPRPVVVLCSDRGSSGRRRFDAAHELGHLLLHGEPAAANDLQERRHTGSLPPF